MRSTSIASPVVENPLVDTSRRYDDGARWGFVTDRQSKRVAVIDTFNNTHADTLELAVIPATLVVSDIQNILVYADNKTPKLYVYDLIKHSQWALDLDLVPADLAFHEDGATLAISGEDRVVLVQPLAKKYLLEIDDLKSPFSINFDAGGYNLYITEQQTGLTHVWRFHDARRSQLQLGNGGAVSEITLSPDSRMALVSQPSENSVVIWDLMMKEHFKTLTFDSPAWRPYVSSDSNHIILATEKGKEYVVDSWSGEVLRALEIGKKPSAIRTGWLETIGVIETKKKLSVFAMNEDTPVRTFPIVNKLNELVVVSDSKSLFATQEGSSQVMVFDIRNGKMLPPVETGLIQPNLMAMGLTNTICH